MRDLSSARWPDRLRIRTYSGLSFLALGFDTLFLVQHYVLYRGAVHEDENVTAESSERDRLLAQSDAATAA